MNEKNPHSFLKKPKNISFLNGGQQFDPLHSGMTLSISRRLHCMYNVCFLTQKTHKTSINQEDLGRVVNVYHVMYNNQSNVEKNELLFPQPTSKQFGIHGRISLYCIYTTRIRVRNNPWMGENFLEWKSLR